MKLFLGGRGNASNIFHFDTLLENFPFNELLQFCNDYFEKDEIMELLTSVNKTKRNFIHLLFVRSPPEILTKNVEIIKEFFGDEMSKQILLSKDSYTGNIFFSLAKNHYELNLDFLNHYFSNSEIADLLMERDGFGSTCLHQSSDSIFDYKYLLLLLNYANKILKSDKKRFEELILAKDGILNTFLHDLDLYPHFDYDSFKELFTFLKEKLSNELYEKFLEERNKYGETFLQRLSYYRKEKIQLFKMVLDEDLFKRLLK